MFVSTQSLAIVLDTVMAATMIYYLKGYDAIVNRSVTVIHIIFEFAVNIRGKVPEDDYVVASILRELRGLSDVRRHMHRLSDMVS